MPDWVPPEVARAAAPAAPWVPPEVASAAGPWKPPEVARAKPPDDLDRMFTRLRDETPDSEWGKRLGGVVEAGKGWALLGGQALDFINVAPMLGHLAEYVGQRTITQPASGRFGHEGAAEAKKQADIQAELLGSGIFEKLVREFVSGTERNTPVGEMTDSFGRMVKSLGDDVESRTNGQFRSEDVQETVNALMLGAMKKGLDASGKAKPGAKPRPEGPPPQDSELLRKFAQQAEEPPPRPKTTSDFPTLAKKGFVGADGQPLKPAKAVPKEIVSEGGVPLRKQAGAADPELLKTMAGFGIGAVVAAKAVPVIMDYLDGEKSREDAIKALEQGTPDTWNPPDPLHPKGWPGGGAPTIPKGPPPKRTLQDLFDDIDANKDRWLKAVAPLGLAGIVALHPRTPLNEIHPRLEYSTRVLESLNKDLGKRVDFTAEQIAQRVNRPEVGKAERELFQGIMEGRQTITAQELAKEIKLRTGDFELKPKETDEYAAYGLENIDRHRELDMDEYFSAQADGVDMSEFEIPPARTTVYELPEGVSTAALEEAITRIPGGHTYFPNSMGHVRSFDEGGVRHVVEIQNNQAQYAEKALRADRESRDAGGDPAQARAWADRAKAAHNVINDVRSTTSDYVKALDSYTDSFHPDVREDVKLRIGADLFKDFLEVHEGDSPHKLPEAVFKEYQSYASDGRYDELYDRVLQDLRAAGETRLDFGSGAAKAMSKELLDILPAYSRALEDAMYRESRRAAKRAKNTGASVAQAEYDRLAPMWKDWWKRVIREEIAQAQKPRENPEWEKKKIELERAEWRLQDDQERYGNLFPDRVEQSADIVQERKAALEATPREIVPGPTIRFATADTVAKVEGWPQQTHPQVLRVEQLEREVRTIEERMAAYEARQTERGLPGSGQVRHGNEFALREARSNLEEARERLQAAKDRGESLAPRFRPEHQSIYDRYRKDIERYLRTEFKAREYTDPKGHTWLEVDLPKGPRQPTRMFGGIDYKFAATLGLTVSAATLAAHYAPQEKLEAALAAGSAALALRAMPKYLKFVVDDWKGALNAGIKVGIAGGLAGYAMADKDKGEHFDPVSAAIGALAMGGAMRLAKSKVPMVGRLTVDQQVNALTGALAQRERTYKNLRREMEVAVPDKARREVIWQAIQDGKDSTLAPNERMVAQAWRGFTASMAADLSGADLLKQFVTDYVTRTAELTQTPKGTLKAALESLFDTSPSGDFMVSSRFLKNRKLSLPDLEAHLASRGMKLNKDIAEVAEVYGRSVGKAVENKKFLEAVKAGGPPDSPYILPAGKAPGTYVPINIPALRGKMVHPEIAPYLRGVMEARSPSDLVNAALALSMAQKRLSVMGSFFHAISLSVAHVGARGLVGMVHDYARAGAKAAGLPVNSPIHAALEAYRKGGLGDQIDAGIRNGLKMSPMADVNLDALRSTGALADATIERLTGLKGRVGEHAAGAVEAVQKKVFDRFTWDFLHAGLKASIFTRNFEKALAKEGFRDFKTAPREVQDRIAAQVAQATNDFYGHLDWNRVAQEAQTQLGRKIANMTLSPNGRIALQILMFAPDWTLSTFRSMWKGIMAMPELATGKAADPVSAKMYAAYTLRTSLYVMGIANLVNLETSGHPIWDNKDPLRIEFKDGTEMQLFKHAAEFGEWVREPHKTFVNKMAFLPSEAVSQIAKQEFPGSKLGMQGSALEHAARDVPPFFARPFFDPALTPGEAAKKSGLGVLGVQTYKHTDEQKERLREQKKRKKEEAEYDRIMKGKK